MKRKIIPWIIIITGLFIVAYPKASELYGDYKQTKLIEEWQQSLSRIDSIDMEEEEEINSLESYGEEELEIGAVEELNFREIREREKKKKEEAEREKKRKEEAAAQKREEYIQKHMEGILKIEKIKFSQPILKGATQNNLNISVASVENTGKAGELGNYAIAGHRNRSFGRNFNRLEEVDVGDKIVVDSGDNQFEYTVTEKLYVYPEEVWVLYSNKEDKEITLITCHPMKNPTHRLIIKGKILE